MTNEAGLQRTEEPPPFGKSWRNWYVAVLSLEALLIALFLVITRLFN